MKLGTFSTFGRAGIAMAIFVVLCGTSAAFAGHYELEDVPFLAEGELAKFAGAGVTSTERLLQEITKASGRESISKQTGISTERLLELAHKVDLLRVNGIGPKMVAMLQAAGVQNLKVLAKQDPEALFGRMVQVNDELHIGQVVPQAGVLKGWINQAKYLPTLLQE